MLTIVIPAFEKVERLRPALRSVIAVARREAPDAEIIVANDGGTPAVAAAVGQIAASCAEVNEVCVLPRGGRSAARNAGARHSRGDRVLFLDEDVLAGRGLLTAHLRRGAAFPDALVRGTILHMPWLAAFDDPVCGTLTAAARRSLRFVAGSGTAPTRLEGRRLELDGEGLPDARAGALARMRPFERDLHAWLEARPVDAPGRWVASTGGNLSVGRECFLRLGGFDERMGLRWGAEDLEFGYRAEKAGCPVVHAPDAVVYHLDHQSPDRRDEHQDALEYFAAKHRDPSVLRLQAYFFGSASLAEALQV